MKTKLALFCGFIFFIGNNVVAYDAKIDGIYYNFSRNEAKVTYQELYHPSYSGAVVIPETVIYNSKLYSVTRIDNSAFEDCINLKSVIIGDRVTSIGISAFSGCSSLTSVTLGLSVISIANWAFEGCKSLSTIIGLNGDISLGTDVFKGCPFRMDNINSFENYSYNYIFGKIKDWQKKGEFETTAQYQARVTKEKQQKKIEELTQEAIREYTKRNPLKVEIGNYDADNEYFLLNTNYGNKYVRIPISVAPKFKNDFNFRKVSFKASYFPTKERLVLDSLLVLFNNKYYLAERNPTEIATTTFNIDLPEVEIPLNSKPQQNLSSSVKAIIIDYSIDQNIPSCKSGNDKTFAVIIGNEKYTQVAQVPYASNDAKIFAEYCKNTLGLPEKNVRQYENATFGTILAAIGDVRNIAKAYNGNINIIFYYAGHGIPNETSRDAFLLPVDANGQQTEACYPISRLYKELGELGAKNVVVFLDACFSGSQRGDGMLASARGVAIKAKSDSPQGNMIVFSAATGDETAYPYKEKGHGMFTYFLLKKLRETKGECTLGELGQYIQENVLQQSVVINRKSQTPTITPSQSLVNTWKSLKLK